MKCMKPPFNLWCTVTLRREFIWVLLYKPPLGFSSFPSRRLHVEPPPPWRQHSPELTSPDFVCYGVLLSFGNSW
ncbi:hypothetical protein HanXRQr2_Chr13g0575271 [Helianthus annuus]|uniref:Uncharacterized protein n=1 Tax=Helianthus annuus TaxID=4232 RepID=A0A251UKH7_HELAN|nr:hypothetical protein HanXRQr2_Chr13g0575271 [Helianthus annuus]KAJ0475933.1 hypothetical protein HanHA300_Chr13g0471351 [Helianthus annuus]KAJ0496735.1 hypothetical protein HanHA89_Chr13g0503211 [Helianthus annuus]KAJ0662779.1 hypothetical protein HanLR1_Chr13g0473551 [Helianthus annuus]KAJ0670291.1 hypothetical protein HanOQP8_Chr13g0472511 [Helianthus annuus]